MLNFHQKNFLTVWDICFIRNKFYDKYNKKITDVARDLKFDTKKHNGLKNTKMASKGRKNVLWVKSIYPKPPPNHPYLQNGGSDWAIRFLRSLYYGVKRILENFQKWKVLFFQIWSKWIKIQKLPKKNVKKSRT